MSYEYQSDEWLIERVEQLRLVPPRDPQASARGRARFMTEVELIGPGGSKLPNRRHIGWFDKIHDLFILKEHVTVFTTLTSIFVALVLFFGGAGATAYAAQGALPGDALYPVKTATEDLRLAVTADNAGDARLYNEFVQQRVNEIDSLASKGRYDDIPSATSRLELQVRQIAQVLATLAGQDPVQAKQLSSGLREALAQQVRLKESLRSGQFEFEFLGIVETIGSDVWAISGQAVAIDSGTKIAASIFTGDLVKVRAMIADDGSLTAVEIEPVVNQGRDGFKLTGIVESKTEGSWVVAGRAVLVTPQTRVKDTVAVGDYVEVEGVLTIDGSLAARQIKLADDGGGSGNGNDDNENLNENENGNDDNSNEIGENDNGNCNGDDCIGNGNDDNENVNDNENDDNGNEIGENDNGNCNGDDCEHQGNENDNGNVNDNENGNGNDSGENVNGDDGNENDHHEGNENDNDNDNDHDDRGIHW